MDETYKVYAAFSDGCWRQRLDAGEHGTLESAIKEARRLCGNGVCPDVPLVVATGPHAQELYRAEPPDEGR